TGRFDMIGQRHLVHIRDSALTLDATTAAYFLRQERLEAHKNVVAVNRSTGSVLRGPNLTYYRIVKGIRDTMEMYASARPTIDYRSSAPPDSAEPYVIVADRLAPHGRHDSPDPRAPQAAARLRLEPRRLHQPRPGGLDPQHDRRRFARARHARRGADRSPGVPARLLDLQEGLVQDSGRGLD